MKFEFKEQAKQFNENEERFLAYTKKKKKFTFRGEKEEFDYLLEIIKIDKYNFLYSKTFKSPKYLMDFFDKLTFEKVKECYENVVNEENLKSFNKNVEDLKIKLRSEENKVSEKNNEIHKLKLEMENLRLTLTNTITKLTEKSINDINDIYRDMRDYE